MLSNAYFLAKFRFDTAENEPAKNLQNLLISPILLTLTLTPPPEKHVRSLAELFAEPRPCAGLTRVRDSAEEIALGGGSKQVGAPYTYFFSASVV